MLKLRIITSDQSKIVINSSGVYLGLARQHAQVGHKNINIFSYQKSSRQILHKRKTIHIKIFTSLICAIFGTGASHNLTHNISKNWIQGTHGF
jgi:hypothetical protein